MNLLLIVILAVITLTIIITINQYNQIVKKRNETRNAFSSIDVMLKKRFDLIPNLVEVTKNYMIHEQTVLIEITRLRAKLNTTEKPEEKEDTVRALNTHVNNMLTNVENYPDLKADKSFLTLMANWTSAEEHISASRRFYNSAVTDYNNCIQQFPSVLIANLFNFNAISVLETDNSERSNISAKELFRS